jgi:hypothetical protein
VAGRVAAAQRCETDATSLALRLTAGPTASTSAYVRTWSPRPDGDHLARRCAGKIAAELYISPNTVDSPCAKWSWFLRCEIEAASRRRHRGELAGCGELEARPFRESGCPHPAEQVVSGAELVAGIGSMAHPKLATPRALT